MNCQQIPAQYKDIRQMFIPKEGNVFINCDYSQQEMMAVAALAHDKLMLESFAKGRDIYSHIASIAFGVPYEDCLEFYPDGTTNKEGKARRKKAKAISLGITYGKGVPAIADDLHVSIEKAQEIKDSILGAFPDLKAYLDDVVEFCKQNGYVKTFYGRKRRLPDIQLDEYTFDFFGELDENAQRYYKGLYLGKLKKCRTLTDKKYIINQAMTKGIKIHQNGGLIAKATRESYNCVDKETEILTINGWKHYDEISVGEKVLSYNMKTKSVEWDEIKDIHIYRGNNIEVVEFSQPNFSAVITHNHRWVVNSANGEVVKTTDELLQGNYEILNMDYEYISFGKLTLLSAEITYNKIDIARCKDTTTDLVWCPTTGNGTWIARRHNTMYITKNSPVQGCLRGTTNVLTKEYGLTHIQDVVDKDLTIWDGENFVKASCLYSGKKQLVRITFTDNRVIECSPYHKFLTLDIRGNEHFYPAADLCEDITLHQVVLSGMVEDFDCSTEQNDSFEAIKDRYELGYVLGWWYTSGIIDKFGNCRWIFQGSTYDYYHSIFAILDKYFSVRTVGYAAHDNEAEKIHVIVDNEALGNQARFRYISSVVNKSREAIRGFLSACAVTISEQSGNMIILNVARENRFSESFMRTLQIWFSVFGIPTQLVMPSIHEVYPKLQVLDSDTYSDIIKRKNMYQLSVSTVGIKSIEITNEFVDMYDIVNSKSHRFVASGVVTHNSAADITKKAMLNIATNERLKELGAEMVLTIHDETMTSVPKENAYEAAKLIEKCSLDAGEGLGAPLRCDIAISDRWEGQQYTFDDNHNLIPLGEEAK